MSTNSPLSPTQVRENIVKGLRRALVGPTVDGDISWPGEALAFKNIDDPSFVPDLFPVGPWCDSDGNEVIHRDPRFVYTVGVLHPISSASDEPQPAAVDEDDNEPNPVPNSLVDEDFSEEDSIDNVDPFVNFSKFLAPRSIGFTIHPKDSAADLRINIAGAWYEPRVLSNYPHTWWVRREFKHSASLSSIGSSVSFTPRGSSLVITVGTTARFHQSSRLVTVWIRNDSRVSQGQSATSAMIFQTELSAETGSLIPMNAATESNVDGLDLLYSSEVLLASGHGCDVSVNSNSTSATIVRTETMPIVDIKPLTPDITDAAGVSLAIGMNDLAEFNETATTGVEKLIAEYDDWLSQRRLESLSVSSNLQEIAQAHLDACSEFLNDMRSGWTIAQSNQDVRACLGLASGAMNQQRRAYNAPPRKLGKLKGNVQEVEGVNPHSIVGTQAYWRPFQIAFILAQIPRFVERREAGPNSRAQDWVNVIWMPTGGGKTEAYLGLAAFVILWERLNICRRDEEVGSSMKVLMRYTYRLLTVQQVSRAASLICALELIRRANPEKFGNSEIRIGAWLGESVTPNTRKAAVAQLRELLEQGKKRNSRNFLLSRCPWCGTETTDSNGKPAGYKVVVVGKDNRVLAFCPDSTCDFHIREVIGSSGAKIQRGIPFLEVDEDIYAQPPDFVVGTVDKTARCPWKPEAQSLFGLNHRKDGNDPNKRQSDPPALLIQDELHLITGPLGTIDGIFEILLEEFCTQSGGLAPVYVAATATTKNFDGQSAALYRRPARLVPPPALSIDNSFFARRDADGTGKIYVGVCATGSIRGLDTQTAVIGSLAFHAAVLGPERMGEVTDPWWTNVIFFSSRRALGLLSSAAATSLGQRIKWLRALSGKRSGRKLTGGPPDGSADRHLRKIRELTATSSDDINQVLDDLSIALPSDDAIDLCMATSMIEVGLDVSRLGLMTVIGQPKTASQYIQATGRVGRSTKAAGLVVTVFKATTPRDLAHYEEFTHWHRRMYASVESASVTPFTREALQRSLPSYMAAMLRMLCPSDDVAPSLANWTGIVDRIVAHIHPSKLTERAALLSVANDLYHLAASPDARNYVWDQYSGKGEPLMFGADSEIPSHRIATPVWRVMNSMRSVDTDSLVNLKAIANDRPEPRDSSESEDDF